MIKTIPRIRNLSGNFLYGPEWLQYYNIIAILVLVYNPRDLYTRAVSRSGERFCTGYSSTKQTHISPRISAVRYARRHTCGQVTESGRLERTRLYLLGLVTMPSYSESDTFTLVVPWTIMGDPLKCIFP